jgi:phenylacetic acid degradation operon negative regulatory protein
MTAVAADRHDDGPAGSRATRTMTVTFLGSVVRRMGGWMPIAGTIDLMGQVGRDAPSVRTAVFRLKKRGWLAPETRDGRRGYALTPLAQTALASGDAVIWHARQPAELADGWCLVTFSIPEAARSRRHQLRAHLAALGFGNIGAATWLAPARMRAAAEQAIGELGLDELAAVFVGEHVGGQDLSTLLHDGWDLDGIDRRYRDFVARFGPEAERLPSAAAVDPRTAFVTYLEVVDRWRQLPFRDPGLPRQLLPPDWSGPTAVGVFETLVDRLEGRALGHAAGYW